MRRDVKRKRIIPTFVRAHGYAVDKHLALPVDRSKMQQHIFPPERRRKRKCAAIPKLAVLADGLANAGEGRLNGERNKNLPFISTRPTRGSRLDRIVPVIGGMLPSIVRHLRTGIVGQRGL